MAVAKDPVNVYPANAVVLAVGEMTGQAQACSIKETDDFMTHWAYKSNCSGNQKKRKVALSRKRNAAPAIKMDPADENSSSPDTVA